MDFGIRGKMALVSASSAGLGFAAAKRLSAEGARVAICGRTRETLEWAAETIRAETDGDILPVVADVSRAEECEKLVHTVEDKWGPVHILVNNSGGPAPGPFEVKRDEEWQAGIEATLMNVVRLIRLVLPGMKQEKWGRVVSITSSSVKEPVPDLLLSNSIRPAIHGLTKSLARELGPFGITVNTVEPGYYLTQRLHELAKVNAGKRGTSEEKELEKMAADVPLQRLGKPDELGAAIAFLCSGAASYITGTNLLVDGGRTSGTSY